MFFVIYLRPPVALSSFHMKKLFILPAFLCLGCFLWVFPQDQQPAASTPMHKSSHNALICGITDGKLTPAEILADGRIHAEDSATYTIKSFWVVYQVSGENKILETHYNGSGLPDSLRKTIQKTGSGSVIWIYNIMGMSNTGKETVLRNISIHIK